MLFLLILQEITKIGEKNMKNEGKKNARYERAKTIGLAI